MATKHWVRDVLLVDDGDYIANGNNSRAMVLFYHFLRNAGFEWLWECSDGDGSHPLDPNQCPDGNMEQVGTGAWTATGGGSLAKVTTPVRSGTQALEVTVGGGGGVQSSALLNTPAPVAQTGDTGDSLIGPDANGIMKYTGGNGIGQLYFVGGEFTMSGSSQSSNNGRFPIVGGPEPTGNSECLFYNPSGVGEGYVTTTYEVSVAVKTVLQVTMYVANSGPTLDVRIDRGDGSPVAVGTIPNNGGVSTRYHFAFAVQGSGSCYVYVENPSTGPAFYIDSILVWRSLFEYFGARDEAVSGGDASHYSFTNNLAMNHYGVDGALTNPDQFSTGAGDSYSPSADDIGKHLVIWDATNNKNSGIYRVIADLGGGAVQVDLRSATAAFVNATGLNWRIVNIDQILSRGVVPNGGIPWQYSAGFGLESPHTSKWRYFMRFNQNTGQTVKSYEMWGAPEDTDFNQSTGHFWMTGPSVMRNRVGLWTRNVGGGGDNPAMHTTRGAYTYQTTDTQTRFFLITDEDLSFFNFVHYDTHGGNHSCFLVGYHEPDVDHPGVMGWVMMARWEAIGVANDIYFDTNNSRFAYNGTSFDESEIAVSCSIAQLGYSSSNESLMIQTNAKANPWSGEEWLSELRFANDADGIEGHPTERDAGADFGVFQGRGNMTDLTPFDSNNYLHLDNGLVWEWSGEALAP